MDYQTGCNGNDLRTSNQTFDGRTNVLREMTNIEMHDICHRLFLTISIPSCVLAIFQKYIQSMLTNLQQTGSKAERVKNKRRKPMQQ